MLLMLLLLLLLPLLLLCRHGVLGLLHLCGEPLLHLGDAWLGGVNLVEQALKALERVLPHLAVGLGEAREPVQAQHAFHEVLAKVAEALLELLDLLQLLRRPLELGLGSVPACGQTGLAVKLRQCLPQLLDGLAPILHRLGDLVDFDALDHLRLGALQGRSFGVLLGHRHRDVAVVVRLLEDGGRVRGLRANVGVRGLRGPGSGRLERAPRELPQLAAQLDDPGAELHGLPVAGRLEVPGEDGLHREGELGGRALQVPGGHRRVLEAPSRIQQVPAVLLEEGVRLLCAPQAQAIAAVPRLQGGAHQGLYEAHRVLRRVRQALARVHRLLEERAGPALQGEEVHELQVLADGLADPGHGLRGQLQLNPATRELEGGPV
mmetsp:Transcript_19097/g.60072  ORF Transcript_19097/g.60072 Transcript_19097/m.60072 type:complete len:377 (+) Transcript_19097:42-1172(+)